MRAGIAYEEEQRSLLQFTGLDSFLVRDVDVVLGSPFHSRNLLASASPVLGEHDIAGRSYRLYCQLDKESNSSLRDYRTTLPYSRYPISAFRCTDHSHRASRCVAICFPWYWDRVFAGMEVREAFIVKAFRCGVSFSQWRALRCPPTALDVRKRTGTSSLLRCRVEDECG